MIQVAERDHTAGESITLRSIAPLLLSCTVGFMFGPQRCKWKSIKQLIPAIAFALSCLEPDNQMQERTVDTLITDITAGLPILLTLVCTNHSQSLISFLKTKLKEASPFLWGKVHLPLKQDFEKPSERKAGTILSSQELIPVSLRI
ncbi:hypothetical protein AV530_016768 [Patagioenas fasciata monilis]|uniref:Uncharacterized protein n=1 Tax=Patagioenas fasciata monilis TaxID=372326 RepID=A0A1V4J3J3_PATFA|nr:hypothetical protein AV530_016768 [Patagioenas fasciata monilis]